MAKNLNPAELVSFKELQMAHSIQVDTLYQLLIEKGLISQEDFFQTGTPKLDSKRPEQTISENKHDISTKRFE